LRRLVKTKVVPEGVMYTDGFRPHGGPAPCGFKHFRINCRERFATRKRRRINGVENFRGQAKARLKNCYGVSREHFYFYLKEMEPRFKHRKAANLAAFKLAALIKRIVRKDEAVPDRLLFCPRAGVYASRRGLH
jgi:transposase-like protein